MLPRATLRALRLSSLHHPHIRARTTPIVSLLSRRHASDSNRPRRPPPPISPSSRPARPPPPSSSGPARQTSPGTNVPKDQTWKPKDGIKLAGTAPAAAVPSAANAANRAEDASRLKAAKTPVDGTRPVDAGDIRVQQAGEPLAQKLGADEPAPGSAREEVMRKQAEAENTPPPPEAPQPPAEEAAQEPQQPLPDLRQGIPSTFDLEYGSQKQQPRSEPPSQQTDGVDITATPPTQYQRRERSEHRDDDSSHDRRAYETSIDRRRAQMANWLYATMLLLSTTGAFYLARPFSAREEVPSNLPPSDITGWSPTKMYARIRARLGSQLGYYTEPTFPKLLPEVPESQRQPFTLVLSLEDLMIHSTWSREKGYQVAKRPGIDYFIRYLSQYYELVLFTSVPLAMADPVIKKLDPYHFIMWPLGREATKYEGGEYVKDLSYLNRDLKKTIIVDTHAPHVKNQPENAIILPKWNGDVKDAHTKDLVALIPFLEYVATMGTDDVRPVLASFSGSPSIPEEFARRESLARAKFQEQLAAERHNSPKRSLGSLASALGIKSTPGMGGGMVLADGQSVAEGLKQGKMLSDQIREQGQKQYEMIEKQIREHGESWLREEAEEQKRLTEEAMRDMKKSGFGWFGGGKKEGE